MTGTQTALVVGGIAVGAFVLAKALAPPRLATNRATTPASSQGSVWQGLVAAGVGGALDWFTKPKPTSTPFYDEGESFEDFTTGLFGPGVYEAHGR